MFDPDLWNGEMRLDNPGIIQDVKKTGARCGRWNKGGAFEKVNGAVLMCNPGRAEHTYVFTEHLI